MTGIVCRIIVTILISLILKRQKYAIKMLYILIRKSVIYQSLARYTLALCRDIYNFFGSVQFYFCLNILYKVTGSLCMYVSIPKSP